MATMLAVAWNVTWANTPRRWLIPSFCFSRVRPVGPAGPGTPPPPEVPSPAGRLLLSGLPLAALSLVAGPSCVAGPLPSTPSTPRSEEHTSELQSRGHLV